MTRPGELESNWNFQIGLSLFSEVGEVSAMICDEDGYVVICSCDNLTCDHVGKQVPESYRREMLREGVYYEKNVRLADIYDDARFLAGQAVVNDQTGNLVGFVVVTAPMNQTTDYMLRSSTFFIYTAIGALGLALVAATFLSRSLVRPLGQMADVARPLRLRRDQAPRRADKEQHARGQRSGAGVQHDGGFSGAVRAAPAGVHRERVA